MLGSGIIMFVAGPLRPRPRSLQQHGRYIIHDPVSAYPHTASQSKSPQGFFHGTEHNTNFALTPTPETNR